jgi:hypothetical protein
VYNLSQICLNIFAEKRSLITHVAYIDGGENLRTLSICKHIFTHMIKHMCAYRHYANVHRDENRISAQLQIFTTNIN